MANVIQFIAMTDFPNRINELRRARGYSQEALGERMRTSKMNISRYETGKAELTLNWMRRFAEALDCTPAELLNREDNPENLNDAERDLVARYRAAAPERQNDLLRVAETLIPFAAPPHDRDVA